MKKEVWLRGPMSDVPPLVQPVAHALLQAREEVEELMIGFPAAHLWDRPAGVASVAFHLQHLTGVLDRLFTYARGEMLSGPQREWLSAEGKPDDEITVEWLVQNFRQQVNRAIDQLKVTDESQLTQTRGVGVAQISSTVIGLYTHAAEHSMRHVGQLLVTVRFLTAESGLR